jgi:hypothetical protein
MNIAKTRSSTFGLIYRRFLRMKRNRQHTHYNPSGGIWRRDCSGRSGCPSPLQLQGSSSALMRTHVFLWTGERIEEVHTEVTELAHLATPLGRTRIPTAATVLTSLTAASKTDYLANFHSGHPAQNDSVGALIRWTGVFAKR